MEYTNYQTAYLIVKAVLNFFFLFIYFSFLMKLRVILNLNGRELDKYMKATLALLGISILLLQLTPL